MRLAQILIVLMAGWMLNNINEYKDDEDDEDDKQMTIMIDGSAEDEYEHH